MREPITASREVKRTHLLLTSSEAALTTRDREANIKAHLFREAKAKAPFNRTCASEASAGLNKGKLAMLKALESDVKLASNNEASTLHALSRANRAMHSSAEKSSLS